MTRRLLAVALSSALSASFALPAWSQDPPPAPQPPPPVDRNTSDTDQDPVQLEQDALDPVGTDPAQAAPDVAKGDSRPGDHGKQGSFHWRGSSSQRVSHG